MANDRLRVRGDKLAVKNMARSFQQPLTCIPTVSDKRYDTLCYGGVETIANSMCH
jgi:hypothetical protein